jgi:UTP--glucose-1-phosphate uridylyltransferase
MDILDRQVQQAGDDARVWLSPALAELARQEQYLALEKNDWRYDVGARYGLLIAQLALALSGRDRDQVLTKLLELLALREAGDSLAAMDSPGAS